MRSTSRTWGCKMLIDFNAMKEACVPNLDGGEGAVLAKMTVNGCGRFVLCRIPPKSSIGLHTQKSGNDINFVVSGTGVAICDGAEEPLSAGVCHICPRDSAHEIRNTGDTDLVLFTAVGKRERATDCER